VGDLTLELGKLGLTELGKNLGGKVSVPNGSLILNRYLYLSDGWLGLDIRTYKKRH
jgi:hypothetical protein